MAARDASAWVPALLLPEVVQNVAPHLLYQDLLRLLACCRELRAATDLELDLSSVTLRASHAVALASTHARRFRLTVAIDRCDQSLFDRAVALPITLLAVRPPDSHLQTLRGVGMSSGLRALRLLYSVGASIDDLSPLAQCSSLITLAIHNAGSLTDISPLTNCRSLHTLDLRRCARLHDISALARFAAWQLAAVTLQGCLKLQDVGPLATLRSLQTLDLSLCSALEDASPLGMCAELRTLNLTGCRKLRILDGLAACPRLHTLFATGCQVLTEVAALAKSRSLHALHLNKCPSVTDVSELGHCATLQLLNLRCSGVVHVPCRNGLRVEFEGSQPAAPQLGVVILSDEALSDVLGYGPP